MINKKTKKIRYVEKNNRKIKVLEKKGISPKGETTQDLIDFLEENYCYPDCELNSIEEWFKEQLNLLGISINNIDEELEKVPELSDQEYYLKGLRECKYIRNSIERKDAISTFAQTFRLHHIIIILMGIEYIPHLDTSIRLSINKGKASTKAVPKNVQESWQKIAEEKWQSDPNKSKTNIAKIISKKTQTKYSVDTIRKKIEKPGI